MTQDSLQQLFTADGEESDTIKILVVDDDEEIRELLSFKLGQRYSVAAVANGDACLDYLNDPETPVPDVITLDLMMPKLNGFEILEVLDTKDKFDAVKPVVVSGLGGDDNLSRAFELGAADFVRKPISFDELAIRIERLLP